VCSICSCLEYAEQGEYSYLSAALLFISSWRRAVSVKLRVASLFHLPFGRGPCPFALGRDRQRASSLLQINKIKFFLVKLLSRTITTNLERLLSYIIAYTIIKIFTLILAT